MDVSVNLRKDPDIDITFLNNSPYAKIKLSIGCSIKSASDSFNYETKQNIEIIENSISSYLEELTLEFLYKISHDYNLDICNFKNIISPKYLTNEEFNKINWNEVYKNSFFNVEIESLLDHNGLLTEE